jgi:hypothetical protein
VFDWWFLGFHGVRQPFDEYIKPILTRYFFRAAHLRATGERNEYLINDSVIESVEYGEMVAQ